MRARRKLQSTNESQRFGRALGRLSALVRVYGMRFVLVIIALAITVAIRIKLLDYRGGDMKDGFLVWCADIEAKGFAKALIGGDCNYNAPYVYLLWLATKIPFERATVIKCFTILFDYIGAAALALVAFRACRSKFRAALVGFTVLVAPTVVFNGALWGQCDMVYAAPLAVALAAAQSKRYYLAASLFGLAISIKLQAIFLFPLLGVWILRRELRLRALLLLPAVYLATLIPAWLAGCSWADLLMIYVKQAKQYSGLTLNAPTIFVLLPDEETWFEPFGLWFAVATVFMLFLACVYARAKTTATVLVRETVAFASLAPFLLPHMHERYLFMADLTSIVYAFVFPSRFWVAACMVGASFAGYSSFLFSKTPVPMAVASTMMGVASVAVVVDLVKHHFPGAFRAAMNEPDVAVHAKSKTKTRPEAMPSILTADSSEMAAPSPAESS